MASHVSKIFDDGELEFNEETGAWEESPSLSSIIQYMPDESKGEGAEETLTPPMVPVSDTAVAAHTSRPRHVILTPADRVALHAFGNRMTFPLQTNLEARTDQEARRNIVVVPKISNMLLYQEEIDSVYDLRCGALVRIPDDQKELKKIFRRLFDFLARPLFFATFGVDYEKFYDVGGMTKEVWLDCFTELELQEMARELRGRFFLRFIVRTMQLKQMWQELLLYPPIPLTMEQLEETAGNEDQHEERRKDFANLFTPQIDENDAWLRHFYNGFSNLLNIEKMLSDDGPEVRAWMVFCVSKMSELIYKHFVLPKVYDKSMDDLFRQQLADWDATMDESVQ